MAKARAAVRGRNDHERLVVQELQELVALGCDGIAGAVLSRGRWWNPARRPEGVKRRKARLCFSNSQMLAIDSSLTCCEGYVYCEGYALSQEVGLVIHHG